MVIIKIKILWKENKYVIKSIKCIKEKPNSRSKQSIYIIGNILKFKLNHIKIIKYKCM